MKHIITALSFGIVIVSSGQPIYTTNNTATAGIAAFSLVCSSVSMYQHYKIKRNLLPSDTITKFRGPIFDRSAIRRQSHTAAVLSDVSVVLCVSMPLTLIIQSNPKLQRSTYGAMLLENAAFTLSFTSLVKTSVRRNRPYVYNPDVPADKKSKPDARYSFFSGHTALSFCSATIFSATYARMYPQSSRKYTYGVISFGLATTTGVMRYLSGKHFPSDIVAGALVGMGSGFLITKFHSQK